MTLGELNHSRSPLCWLAWAVLHTLLKRSSREGTPDLNLLFQYNMPVRALAQMTGGMVGEETVDGIVMEAKGFWIIGLLRALIGFGQNAVSNRKFRAALDAERGGPAVKNHLTFPDFLLHSKQTAPDLLKSPGLFACGA